MPGRACAADLAHHRAALADQDLLLALRLGVDADVHELVVELDHLGRDGVRHLLLRQAQRLLAHELGDARLERHVGVRARREVHRPLGQQRDQVAAQLVDPVARHRAHRMQRVEVAEPRGLLHLRRDVPVLQPVDLVDDDHDGQPEREDLAGDELVARSDPVARADDEQDRVDVVARHRVVDRSLHALGQRVDRALPAREIDEHELCIGGRVHTADPVARRVRLVGDDRDLRAGERVHQRRLPDVRPSRDGDEPRPHSGRFHVSGSSSAADIVPIEPSSRR